MGKYQYIIYNSYPSKIQSQGEFWAWSLKHAYRKIVELANDKFFTICQK